MLLERTELRNAEVEVARKVQSAAEELEHFDERQEAVCREWKAVFNQFYARGRQNGARKETLASVVRKSAFGGALAAPLAFLLPFAFIPALLGIPVAVGVGLFTYFKPSPPPPRPRPLPRAGEHAFRRDSRGATPARNPSTRTTPAFERRL